MKNIFRILVLIACIFTTTNVVIGQWVLTKGPAGDYVSSLADSGKNPSPGKFRALLKTGDQVEIRKGILSDSTLLNLEPSGIKREILISDIRALDRSVGTQALKGAAIGGGIGLLSSLLAVAEVGTDPNRKLKDNAGVIVAGITVGFSLIGLLVGSAFDEWERVPIRNASQGDLNPGSRYRFQTLDSRLIQIQINLPITKE